LGFRVYIGTHAGIYAVIRAKKNKSGIYFDKSTQPEKLLKEIQKKVDHICILDIELSPVNAEENLNKIIPERIYSNSLSYISRFYVSGILSKTISEKYIGIGKVINSGWPKWDLINKDYVNRLSKKRFRFGQSKKPFLVFASGYRFLRDPVKMSKFRNVGIIQPNERHQIEYKLYANKLFKNCIKILENWQSHSPNIVIKPHHSESRREWKRATKHLNFVKIAKHSESLDVLLLRSEGLLHTGSTATVHAHLLNKDSFFIKSVSMAERHVVSEKLSRYLVDFENPPRIHYFTDKIDSALINSSFDPKVLEALLTTTYPSNAQNIVSSFEDLPMHHSDYIDRVDTISTYLSFRALRRGLGLIRDELLWFFRKTNVYSQYHAIGGWGISSHSARRFLKKMAPNDKFNVSSVGVNIIVLE
jgi:surface carbohydrate biosynthesis protein